MVEVAKILLEFIIVFIIVYVCYNVLSYKNIKKYDRKKMPTNVKYLVLKYHIDVVKVGYKKVCKTLIMSDSIIIATVFTVTRFIDNIYVRLITAFFLVLPIFAGVYHLVASYYKKESEK